MGIAVDSIVTSEQYITVIPQKVTGVRFHYQEEVMKNDGKLQKQCSKLMSGKIALIIVAAYSFGVCLYTCNGCLFGNGGYKFCFCINSRLRKAEKSKHEKPIDPD